MKKVKTYILTIFSLLLIFFVDFKDINATSNYLKDSGGNYYFDYVTTLNENYYSSLQNLSSQEFKNTLHTIISTNAKDDISYEDCKDLLKVIDEDINNPNNILCILTGKSMTKDSFGANGKLVWNREHIWPKSHGFKELESSSPYNDLHHLRAAEAYTNSTYHNDYDYGEIDGSEYVEDEFGNKYNSSLGSGVYEPRDAVKGDIARMIMYMDVRYEGDSLSENINLVIKNGSTTPTNMTGYLGDLDTLIKWHEQDPVDDLERKRNDKVYSIQGNRNPFIDHPEYANIIYGSDYDAKEKDEYRVLYYVENGTFSYVDIKNYKSTDKVTVPSVEPKSSRYDYTFKNWCTENGEVFDFENDRLTSDLKLFASWEYAPLPVDEMFEMQQTLTGLHLVYKNVKVDEKPVLQTTTVKVVNDGPQGSVAKNTAFNYDEYLDYNKNDIQILYETNSKGNAYVCLGKLKLYPGNTNGTGIRILSREGANAKIVDFTYVTNFQGNLSTSVSKTVASDGSYGYLQNIISSNSGANNQIEITAITITYYTETVNEEPKFDSVSLMFGLELPVDIYSDLLEEGSDIKFGVKISGTEYDATVVVGNDTVKIVNEVIVSNYSTNYSAQAFVKIDGVYYYSKSVSNSVKSIAQTYILSYLNNDLVHEHSVALKYIINS